MEKDSTTKANQTNKQLEKVVRKKLLESVKVKQKSYKDVSPISTYLEECLTFLQQLDSNTSIDNILIEIGKIRFFKNYDSFQLLVHQKGDLFFRSIKLSSNNISQQEIFNLKEFNSIFSSVKKSKYKLFDARSFDNNFIDSYGNFLGKEFSKKSFSCLLFLSRNDFLPQTDFEISSFNTFCDKISDSLIFACDNYYREQVNLLGNNISSKLGITHNTSSKKKENSISIRNKFVNYDLSQFEISSTDYYQDLRLNILGELLNNLRHELSNPLFGIKLSSELLQGDLEDEEYISMLEEINKKSVQCQDIIDTFSNFFDQNEFSNNRQVELISFIKKVISLTKSETKECRIELNSLIPNKEIFLTTNPSYLSQILFNLIINAKESQDHKDSDKFIKININLENDILFISIQDNGDGIPIEKSDKLFEPFYTTKSYGTGLGLNICMNLAKALSGTIAHKSSENNGACFTLELPFINE